MKHSTLRSSSGFSLVELMVVVAIIGVLATMSVGQVQKQIAKARQAEAKTNLAALYTSEGAFRAEYNTFCTDFGVIKLEYTGRMRYGTGFTGDHMDFAAVQAFGYPAAGATNGVFQNCAAGCQMSAEAQAPAATSANQTAFVASARSDIYQAGTPDSWEINQNKTLTQVADGIP